MAYALTDDPRDLPSEPWHEYRPRSTEWLALVKTEGTDIVTTVGQEATVFIQ